MNANRDLYLGKAYYYLSIYLYTFLLIAFLPYRQAAAQSKEVNQQESIDSYVKNNGYYAIGTANSLSVKHGSGHIKVEISTYIRDNNNNHSYEIIILSTDINGRKFIIPFDQPDKSSQDFITSSLYNKCRGSEIYINASNNQIRILEIKSIGSSTNRANIILRKLSFNESNIAGDANSYFEIIENSRTSRQCNDSE